MSPLPTVTIAIPTYNRVDYLRQAVRSALSQTYPHLQVIVSDNCSHDGTADAVSAIRDSRLVFLRQQVHLEMAGNWNACLAQATGAWFLLLSDDDYLEPQAIEKMIAALSAGKQPEKVGVVACRTRLVGSDNARLAIFPAGLAIQDAREFALDYFRGIRSLLPCSTLLRTADLRQIGGYSHGSVVLAVDAVAWSRVLLMRGSIASAADLLANYRVHVTRATTTQNIAVWQNDIRVLVGLWAEAFQDSPPGVRRQFERAARNYESSALSDIIYQSGHSLRSRIRAIGTYVACRRSFGGRVGKIKLLSGIVRLLLPEMLKRPIRMFVGWRQELSA